MAIPEELAGEIDWETLGAQVRRFIRRAYGRSFNSADIEELSQECLAQVLEPASALWTPEGGKTLLEWACGAVWGIVHNRWRRDGRKYRHLRSEEDDARPLAELDSRSKPLDVALRDRRAISLLRESVAKDAEASSVLDASLYGCERYPDFRRKLGIPRNRFENAKERIGRHVERLRHRLGGDGDGAGTERRKLFSKN